MSSAKDGRFARALSNMAMGLGIRKNVLDTKKLADKKPEGAKMMAKTSILPNKANTKTSSASTMPTLPLTNQTAPSKSLPSTKKTSKSRSSSSSKASIKPKGLLPKEVGGNVKKLNLSSSSSKTLKETSSSGQKLIKKKKNVVKKKVSSNPRASSSTLSSSKSKSKCGKSLAAGTIKRKIKPKKKRALTIVSTVSKAKLTLPGAIEKIKNEVITISSAPQKIVNNSTTTATDTRIYTRAPMENALLEALRTENLHLDDTLRVSGGGLHESKLSSSSARGNVKSQPSILGTKNISDVPFYTPEDSDWYNDLGENDAIDLRVLPSKLPKSKTSSDHKPNGNKGSSPPNKEDKSASGSPSGSKETPNASSSSQGDNSRTRKEDEDPNQKKKDPNEDNKDRPQSSTVAGSRKRKLTEDNSAKVSNDNVVNAEDPSTSAQSVEDEHDKEDEDKDAKKKKNRCAECRKKVGLTGFQCRCGGLYCAVHRYSDKHNCTFNYREHGAQEIRRNNPVVVGEKIQKI